MRRNLPFSEPLNFNYLFARVFYQMSSEAALRLRTKALSVAPPSASSRLDDAPTSGGSCLHLAFLEPVPEVQPLPDYFESFVTENVAVNAVATLRLAHESVRQLSHKNVVGTVGVEIAMPYSLSAAALDGPDAVQGLCVFSTEKI
jgi:hypothetical protein